MRPAGLFSIALLIFAVPAGSQEISVSDKNPITITSDSWSADNKTQIMTYSGNVLVTHQEDTLRAQKVSLKPGDDVLSAEKDVRFVEKNGSTVTGERAKYIKSKRELEVTGNASLETVGTERITTRVHSDTMRLQNGAGMASAAGNVKVEREDITVRCGKADLYQAEEKVILEGAPFVKKQDDEFHGDNFTIYFKKRLLIADSGVRARFYVKSTEAEKK